MKINKPKIIPKINPKVGNEPVYVFFDSNSNSCEIIYNIVPAAILNENPINVPLILEIVAPKKAPKPVVSPDSVANKNAFVFENPDETSGIEIDIPSGISWIAIARHRENPSVGLLTKPEPIANPSGRLCIERPIKIIIPVLNKGDMFFSLLSTTRLIKYIKKEPINIPFMVKYKLAFKIDSGIKSKHIIDVISPAESSKIKLRIFFDLKFKKLPINPPSVVPIKPKNNPYNDAELIKDIYIT